MDDELIKKEIINQLTFGQWELAKSLILVYWESSPNQKDAHDWISQVLINVCSHPEKYCIASLSVPSKYHLSWLVLQLIEELKIEKSQIAYLRKISEFKLYIYEASKICHDVPFEDFALIFEAQHLNEANDTDEQEISANILNFIYDLKSQNPFLAAFLLKTLLNKSKFNFAFEEITLNWLKSKIILIKGNISKNEVNENTMAIGEQILSEIRVYVFMLSSSGITPQLPIDVVGDLLLICDSNIISKKNLYEVLLVNSESAAAFCEIEDSLLGRNETEKDIESAEKFFHLIFLPDGSINTKELFLRSMRRKEHFLELILNNLLIFMKSRKYIEIDKYLNHRLTHCLRPLLVLLSWDQIETNDDARQILNCLWPDSLDKDSFEPTYVKACDKLVRNVNFAQWCLEEREKNVQVATREDPNFSNICHSLKSHSVVYVLKQYLQLSKLNINAVEDMLLTFMSSKSISKEKCVRFATDTRNEDWEDKVQKSVDCIILQSYCIMSAAMEAVQFSAEFETWCRSKKVRKNRLTDSVTADYEKWTLMYREKVVNNLKEVEQLLLSLYPLVHRLEIVENLFALIFATRDDIRTDVGTDSGQSSEYEDEDRDITITEDEDCGLSGNGGSDNENTITKVVRSLSDGTSVLSNCSGNSGSTLNNNRQGFLCNDTVIRSLLSSINSNLLDISLKFEKRKEISNLVFWNDDYKHDEMREKRFLQRISELKKFVAELIWRFEIIKISDNDYSNNRIVPCPIYLKIENGKKANENVKSNISVTSIESHAPNVNTVLVKSRKRNRTQLTSTQFHGCANTNCFHGTVNKLLSSKESLLNFCIQHTDSIKAHQVIHVFAMAETDSAKEIIFSQKYTNFMKQFETSKIQAMPLIPATPLVPTEVSSSLLDIASAAAAGVTATTNISTVDDFLSRCILPSTSKIKESMRNSLNPFCQELAECRDLKALVLCDLAFTSSQSLDSSASLLHAAIRRLNSIDETEMFPTRSSGLYNFASRIISLISEVSSKQNTQTIYPMYTNLCNLLVHGSIPLLADAYSTDVDNWNNLIENLNTFYGLKSKYLAQDTNLKNTDNQIMTDLHSAFGKIVRDETMKLKQRVNTSFSDGHYPNYLRTMHVYMLQLATLKAHQNPGYRDSSSQCNYLRVLDQGFTSTLIGMIKEKDTNIEWIEKFSMQFGLDVKHLITEACVGSIPASGYKAIEYGNVIANKYGQFILNNNTNGIVKDNPNDVVNDLLVNIICFIRDNCDANDGIVSFKQLNRYSRQIEMLLKNTNKLSSVDLTLLKTSDECCVFLINVANLLAFHATLLRTCDGGNINFGRSRLLNECCQVAYFIGQFGNISLFELHCLLGCTTDLKISESILQSRKSGIIDSFNFTYSNARFLVSRFFLTSPKLIVTSTKNLNDDIISGTAEYLDAHIIYENKEKEISLPDYVFKLIANNENHNIQSFIQSHSNFDQIQNTKTEFKIMTRPTNYIPAVVLSYPKKGFKSFAIEPLPEKTAIRVNEIPKHIRDYLREKCWLVDRIINILQGEKYNDERTVYLNQLLDEFDDISPIEVLFPAIHETNFWIDLETKLIKEDEWKIILNFIDISSEVRLEMKKCITPLRDFILCHLVDENPEKMLPQSMKNVQLQAYIIQTVYRNWDYNKCLNCILRVATDITVTGELKKTMFALYERLSIYGQIITTLSCTDSWQSIEDKSLNNPEEILTLLTLNQHYSVAVEWAKVHILPKELEKTIQHVTFILHLDKEDEPDFIQAILVLEKITDRTVVVEICEEALNTIDNLSSQVFVIEYLVNNLSDHLSEAEKEELHLRHMGIKILQCLPQTDSKYFAAILSSPALVLEQLIMNTKIDLLGKALETIKSDILALRPNLPASADSIKSLLKTYAKKSLEVQIIQAKLTPSSTYEQISGSSKVNSDSFVVPLYPPKKEDWVPDELHSHCMICREEAFNMFNRRHHCRRCGRVVCANCSHNRNYVKGYEDVKVRVCDKCNAFDAGISFNSSPLLATSADRRLKQSGNQDGSSVSSVGSANIQYPRLMDEPYQCLLTLDEDRNTTVRDEFYFEQTPNVSLCISLLDCFLRKDEAAAYVLDLCEVLFDVLKPDKDTGLPNPEMNHNVIVSVIESLIMTAKVKFANLANHAGMGKCDIFLHNLNLIKLLIKSNCHHLVPSCGINSHEAVRRLRNQLVAEERWTLALEVTTKNRLDITGVWASWGLSLLRACDFPTAREKFAQCLEKYHEKKHFSSSASNDLLTEIIKELEVNLYKNDNETLTVKNRIASLKAISKNGGQTVLCPKRIGLNMNSIVRDECLFYIKTYGSPSSLLLFFIKHQKIDLALKIIKEKEYEPALFINSLFMPCLKGKLISQLEKQLLEIDKTLRCWQRYLIAVCKHLDQLKLYNSLLRLQTFCKDYVRSASTCVKLFSDNASDYDILFERLQILTIANSNLEAALQAKENKPKASLHQPKWKGSSSSLQHDLPIEDIRKIIEKVNFQIKITKFFKEHRVDTSKLIKEICETPSSKRKDILVPVVFGATSAKIELCAMILLANENIIAGFEMAVDCIEICHIEDWMVFSLIGRLLIKKHQYEDVHQLITFMKNRNVSSEKIDEIIWSCLLILVQEPYDYAKADKLIEHLTSNQHKINAYTLCGRLRHGYINAIKSSDVNAVIEIAKAAEKANDKQVLHLCNTWLKKQKHTKQQGASGSNN